MEWYLIVILICITLMVNVSNIFFCGYGPFVYLLWRNVYSYPLSIFKLGYLSL